MIDPDPRGEPGGELCDCAEDWTRRGRHEANARCVEVAELTAELDNLKAMIDNALGAQQKQWWLTPEATS